jgi:hypothetical protein
VIKNIKVKFWENASPYGAGGLASRKPEKNKAINTFIFSSSFISAFIAR